jgi:hypothetical protein
VTPNRIAATTRGSYLVALVLAVGISAAINCFTIAVLIDSILSEADGISENATQILTGWGGGVIGVIGAVIGYQAGATSTPRPGVDTPLTETLPGSGSRGG